MLNRDRHFFVHVNIGRNRLLCVSVLEQHAALHCVSAFDDSSMSEVHG